MKKTISILLLALIGLFGNKAAAQQGVCFGDFVVNGLDYSYCDDTHKSVYINYVHADKLEGTTVTIPDTVEFLDSKYPIIALDYGVFQDCPNVDSVIVGKQISTIGYKAFAGTKWESNFPDGAIYIANSLYKYNGAMPEDCHFVVNVGTQNVTNHAFESCTNLSSITFPASVNALHPDLFNGCTNLKVITFYAKEAPVNFASEIVPQIDGTVDEISNTSTYEVTLRIPKGSLDSYTRAGYHRVVKEIVEFEPEPLAFDIISSEEMTAQVAANKMMQLCGEIVIPETADINGKTYKVTTLADDAFANCEELTKVTLPTSINHIGERAFMGCKSLKECNIPNGITTLAAETFADCESLVTVAIPRTMETIDRSAFRGCDNLDEATQESIVKDYINTIYIVGAIIVIILVLFLIKRIKRGRCPKKNCAE